MREITVITVSTGDINLLTVAAMDALKTMQTRILRTARHPIARWLTDNGLAFEALDSLYEKSDTFDAFNDDVVRRLLDAASCDAVVYAVTDAAMDSTVTALLNAVPDINAISILPGVSHADRCLALAKANSLDIRAASAETFLTADDTNPGNSIFLSEIHSRACAGACKLKLMRLLDDQAQFSFFFGDADGTLHMRTIPLFALDRQERYDHFSACMYVAQPLELRKRFSMNDLYAVMKRLRARDGCPWDQEQTHESLLSNLLEESYEFIEAARENDPEHMCEELGDVLLQVVFHAVIAAQYGEFDLHDVTTTITGKLIERHPHVFGNVQANTASQVLENWEQIKRKQRGIDTIADAMDNVPKGLSPAMRAAKVQNKAAKVKFDFPSVRDALEKILEEYQEVLECMLQNVNPEEELGDLLFSAINVCRLSGVNPDIALSTAVDKFIRRFRGIENAVKSDGKSIEDLTLSEMDVYWIKEKHISMKNHQ